jgi:hypothetical protein
MKSRGGFVSNSSSSSFVLYGAYVPIDLDNPVILALFETAVKESRWECDEETTLEDSVSEQSYEAAELLADAAGLEYGLPEGSEPCFGLSPQSFKDDETGAEFKARARAALARIGFTEEPCWHEESWYS